MLLSNPLCVCSGGFISEVMQQNVNVKLQFPSFTMTLNCFVVRSELRVISLIKNGVNTKNNKL